MSSFNVDARIVVKLEYDLAIRVGEYLLNSGTEDKQILALGHRLVKVDEPEEPNRMMQKFPCEKSYSDSGESRFYKPRRTMQEYMQQTHSDE
jgi:hypothetical protein